jgi:hypothetical protein
VSRDKRVGSLWPDHEPETAGDSLIDTLFEEDLDLQSSIHDRHGCTRWFGPVVLFIVLPQVGSTSLDLLKRADPDAYVAVVRLAIRDMKTRFANRKPRREPRTAEEIASDERFIAAYEECGRELPDVSRAFRRLIDESLGCVGFALQKLPGTSEPQLLRSLGLTIDRARTLMAPRKVS